MSCFIQNYIKMKNTVKYICVALVMLPFAGCDPYETWPIGLPELEHVYYVSNVKTGNGTELDIQHEIAADGTASFVKRIHYNPNNPPAPQYEWVTSNEPNVTMPMDIRFISEHVRTYDVTTYFWIENRNLANLPNTPAVNAGWPNASVSPIADPPSLIEGTDYVVLSGSGATMTPNAQGVYSLTWPKAEKAQQSIKIKRLSSATGQLRLMFLDRNRPGFSAPNDAPDRNDLEVTLLNNKTNDYTVRGFWHDYRYPVIVNFR